MIVIIVIPRFLQNLIGNEILACTVALHNRLNQILRHILIVGQELLRILRQTVAPVAERRVVVMRSDARVQTDTLNDGLRIQSLHLRIRIQLVEIAYTQRQIRVGEQLHCLRLLQSHEQRIDVFLDSPFLKQRRKLVRLLFQMLARDSLNRPVLLVASLYQLRTSHDDAAGVEVVVQRLALTQELRREQQVELLSRQGRRGTELFRILHVQAAAVPHGNGTLDDHHRVRIHLQHQVDHLLHVRRIEIILHRIVVRRSRNHHKVRFPVSRSPVERSCQVEFLLRQILLDILILYRADTFVYLLHLFRNHVDSHHPVMLRQQSSDGQAHITRSRYGDSIVFHHEISLCLQS